MFKDVNILFAGIVKSQHIHKHKITKHNFRNRKMDITDVARTQLQTMPHTGFEAGNSVYELVMQ